MHVRLTLILLAVSVMAFNANAEAQDIDLTPGSRVQKIQRDQLKQQFGADHPAVVQLDAQIRREFNAQTNPEIIVMSPTRIEDLDDKAFRRLVVRLMTRIATLEKEVADLKSRISELQENVKPIP